MDIHGFVVVANLRVAPQRRNYLNFYRVWRVELSPKEVRAALRQLIEYAALFSEHLLATGVLLPATL